MSSFSDSEYIGQLFVSKDEVRPEAMGRGTQKIRGSQYVQSPAQFGHDKAFHPEEAPIIPPPIPKPEGTVMIGPLFNTDSPLPLICDPSIKYIPTWFISPCGVPGIGAEKYQERLAQPYPLVVRAGPIATPFGAVGSWVTKNDRCGIGQVSVGTTDTIVSEVTGNVAVTPSAAAAIFIGDVDIYGYTRVKDRLSVVGKADFFRDIVIRRNVLVGSDVVVTRNVTAQGEVKSQCGRHVLSAKKNFDIPHPTKEGWRLTHTCVEGPEASVYVRGRVKNSTEIHLPEYWKGLVNIDTITVNLTPIGSHQDVIIKRWNDSKVFLQSKGGMPIDCFYYIMAERKDTEKLIPEYKGTIEDYPGDNSQRSIAGYHYDIKEE